MLSCHLHYKRKNQGDYSVFPSLNIPAEDMQYRVLIQIPDGIEEKAVGKDL